MLGHEGLQSLQIVSLGSQLNPVELGEVVRLFKVFVVVTILLLIGARVLLRIHLLLQLLVQVHHTKSKVVPQLGVAAEGVRRLLEILERLEILLLFEEG